MADLKAEALHADFQPIRGMSTASGMSGGRKKSVAEEPVSSVLASGVIPVYSERELSADEEVLAALGYKPEFKREFSLWTSFCVSFAVLGLLPSFASTLYYVSTHAGLATGSTADNGGRAWDTLVHRVWSGVG